MNYGKLTDKRETDIDHVTFQILEYGVGLLPSTLINMSLFNNIVAKKLKIASLSQARTEVGLGFMHQDK